MNYFSHEKLDVYQASLEWIILVEEIVKQLPRGRAYLVDQLQRAGTSVLLNIAEGAGEYAIHEKIRFYRMARRSGTECAAIMDVITTLKLIENDQNILRARKLLIRIVSMLTKMVQISHNSEAEDVIGRVHL